MSAARHGMEVEMHDDGRRLLAALCGLLLAAGSALAQAVPRQVAAPPEDLPRLRLPAPSEPGVRSAWALLPVQPVPVPGGGFAWTAALPVPEAGLLRLAWVQPPGQGGRLTVHEARGAELPLQPERHVLPPGSATPAGADALVLRGAVHPGVLTLRAQIDGDDPPSASWLLVRAPGGPELHTFLSTWSTLAGEPFAVLARLTDPADGQAAAGSRIRRADVTVADPVTGAGRTLRLRDDGASGDGLAGDGLFGALLPPLPPGPVRLLVLADGVDAAGAPFVRSAVSVVTVLERAALLSGEAGARLAADGQALDLHVGLLPLGEVRKLHLSAEVWARGEDGEDVPVCWLSRMGTPPESGGGSELLLRLDGRWLARAGTARDLHLRAVRVQDPDTHAVHDALDVLPLAPPAALPASALGPPPAITRDMLAGPAFGESPQGAPGSGEAATLPVAPGGTLPSPGSLGTGGSPGAAGTLPDLSGTKLAGGTLLLVHGYCSSGNIWPAADFAQPKTVFLDPDQNRSNDEFALLLAEAGGGHRSFGVVAHSQGGLAALHLLTYYVSGLGTAPGGRLIQSVASPYQGTPLASLGFFACGVNDDMTPSGAAAWLAGIPTWARQEVFYWTTSNSGSACSFFTDFLLTNPEDGTVERFRGQLPGGNDRGHTLGWCHTTGMSNPANYTDHARNAEMNAKAAR